MKRWLGFLIVSAFCIVTFGGIPEAEGLPQNLTEHSWIYNSGFSDDTRIYQTEPGFTGQKLVTGTRGTGTISRSIDAQVYGGFPDGYDLTEVSEWGVYQNKPSRYIAPLTPSDLRNALCVKNYEVGSQFSESYTDLRDLIKDTSISQTNENSVYNVHSEIEGTARVGARVQRSASSVPIYTMAGTYQGYTNMRLTLESGNASIMTLPCP